MAGKAFKIVEVEAKIAFEEQPEWTRFHEAAQGLADPDILAILLRRAVAETLLLAYRERFLRALPGMVNMRRENFRRGDAVLTKPIRDRFLRASRAYTKAQLAGDREDTKSAAEALRKAGESLRKAVKPPRPSKRPLPHGKFRALALKVLGKIGYDTGGVNLQIAGGVITIGIGNLAALEAIKTPSATEDLTGAPTTSRRQVLWRQLEFGTGAYASDPSLQAKGHRLASGGWWYGRSRAESLELRGSKPGKFLFDPARKLPYERDSVRFRSTLYSLIDAVLMGR